MQFKDAMRAHTINVRRDHKILETIHDSVLTSSYVNEIDKCLKREYNQLYDELENLNRDPPSMDPPARLPLEVWSAILQENGGGEQR